jgi:hypothetical protein
MNLTNYEFKKLKNRVLKKFNILKKMINFFGNVSNVNINLF